MTPELLLNNIALYSLQVGLLIGVAAFIPALLRLRHPGARLAFWHILLAACLVLPLAQPIRRDVIVISQPSPAVASAVAAAPAPAQPSGFDFSRSEFALALLGAGAIGRLAWLALGFWRLRRYRRNSTRLDESGGWGFEADVRLSPEIASPVTFGFRNPVVLLPAGFPDFHARVREAILCHECVHVRRMDWAFIVIEETVRAAFWFHPAIWWLLEEIQLTREQAVDKQAVELTKARDEYVDALLAVAGAKPALDLAPAPLFLRRRHLKTRVVSILKEAHMSKKRLYSALAAALCGLAAACWVVSGAFPLAAAPQVVADAPGVTVDLGGAAIMHRAAVRYPVAALSAHVEGVVIVEVTLDKAGNVTDARVVSGPEALRRTALESVLQWHFAAGAAGANSQVSIAFKAPQTPVAQPTGATPAQPGRLPGYVSERLTVAGSPLPPNAPALVLGNVEVRGLSDQAASELLAKLTVRRGDPMNGETWAKITAAMKDFDEHLAIMSQPPNSANEVNLIITAPQSAPAQPAAAGIAMAQRIKVGANVAQVNLLKRVNPAYPPLAKQARIQGRVVLNAIVAQDGTIKGLTVVSGHPLLVQSAMEAVRQWQYRPTLLNGNPVEVVTEIEINFTLPSEPSPEPAPVPPQ